MNLVLDRMLQWYWYGMWPLGIDLYKSGYGPEVVVLWAQVWNLEFPKIYWVGNWLLPFMYSAPGDKKLV